MQACCAVDICVLIHMYHVWYAFTPTVCHIASPACTNFGLYHTYRGRQRYVNHSYIIQYGFPLQSDHNYHHSSIVRLLQCVVLLLHIIITLIINKNKTKTTINDTHTHTHTHTIHTYNNITLNQITISNSNSKSKSKSKYNSKSKSNCCWLLVLSNTDYLQVSRWRW